MYRRTRSNRDLFIIEDAAHGDDLLIGSPEIAEAMVRFLNTGDWTFQRPTFASLNTSTPVTGVRINEFSASNNFLIDEYGEYDDWI